MKQWVNLYCERSTAESRLNHESLRNILMQLIKSKTHSSPSYSRALQRRDTPPQTCNSVRSGMHRLGEYTHQLSWFMKLWVNLYCERSFAKSSLNSLAAIKAAQYSLESPLF